MHCCHYPKRQQPLEMPLLCCSLQGTQRLPFAGDFFWWPMLGAWHSLD